MSTVNKDAVSALPAFVALDAYSVLERERRGASIQLSDDYFRGQRRAIDAVETASSLSERQKVVSQSRQLYDQIQVDFESLTHESLETASAKFRQILRQLSELQYLRQNFPETCFVVPEWLRERGHVRYGARIYFFREGSAPAPEEIVRRNIEAVVTGERGAFDAYQGRLHGYPECCIEYFTDTRQREAAPELEAVEPIADYIDDQAIADRSDLSSSIEDVVDGLFETPNVYAFLAREFFPEPECDRARRHGLSTYETLCDAYPDELVDDYFRITAGWSYLMANAMAPSTGVPESPSPGSLGREHLLFYLPLSAVLAFSRYQE